MTRTKSNKKSRLIASFLVAGAGFACPTLAETYVPLGGYEPYAVYF